MVPLISPVDITAGAIDVEVGAGVGVDALTVPGVVVERVVKDEVGTMILIIVVEDVECSVDTAVIINAFATVVDTSEVVLVLEPDTIALKVPFCTSARLINSCIWTCDFGLIPKTIPFPQWLTAAVC
jgi:hypothetical protein